MATDLSAPTVKDKSRVVTSFDSGVLRIDRNSYLVIGPDGEYIVSNEPKQLPQGVRVHVINDDIKGQRQFVITKNASDPFDDSDTFDDVRVGTLMVQNGYAYIAGEVIHGEEPKSSNVQIRFPPFVMTYPISVLNTVDDQFHFYAIYEDEVCEKLECIIKDNIDVEANHRCLDFEFDFGWNLRPDLSQEYLCELCGGEMVGGGYDFCGKCVSPTEDTDDEDMDIDDGEDNTSCDVGDTLSDAEALIWIMEKIGSARDVGPSK